MKNATPRPWRIEETEDGYAKISANTWIGLAQVVVESFGDSTETKHKLFPDYIGEDNAKLIVTAVNEYDALVAVAEAAHAFAVADPIHAEVCRLKVCQALANLAAIRNGGVK